MLFWIGSDIEGTHCTGAFIVTPTSEIMYRNLNLSQGKVITNDYMYQHKSDIVTGVVREELCVEC